MNNPLSYLGSPEKVVNHFKQMVKEKKWPYLLIEVIFLFGFFIVLFSYVIVSAQTVIAFFSPPPSSIQSDAFSQIYKISQDLHAGWGGDGGGIGGGQGGQAPCAGGGGGAGINGGIGGAGGNGGCR